MAVADCGPNTEADGRPAYNNVKVGGAPTQKLTESQLTIMCKLGNGPKKDDSKFIVVTTSSIMTPLLLL
ncbi:hypothetical protein CFC57_13535 [Staphylococcus aureus]|nr:hypothetical protein CFC57_13535 [Staphylococcus aureus]